eukprot:CAMPEP_0168585274 /NCGR_PEP_ID=MMETSP0420-20121227/3607_1 /TAXON_ID=498008 /ORGANISM="Pessonella sp." /LENGTH=757 /DNA_ID=CAMNT_0008620175 /DNA_START=124 /DNA_END=2397 /DNA_ORIENTATION=-
MSSHELPKQLKRPAQLVPPPRSGVQQAPQQPRLPHHHHQQQQQAQHYQQYRPQQQNQRQTYYPGQARAPQQRQSYYPQQARRPTTTTAPVGMPPHNTAPTYTNYNTVHTARQNNALLPPHNAQRRGAPPPPPLNRTSSASASTTSRAALPPPRSLASTTLPRPSSRSTSSLPPPPPPTSSASSSSRPSLPLLSKSQPLARPPINTGATTASTTTPAAAAAAAVGAATPSSSSLLDSAKPLNSTASTSVKSKSPSSRFYFTLDQIRASLGMDAELEETTRRNWCTFIHQCSMDLAIPQLTIATAAVFFHRFYVISPNKNADKFVVATACLFLAGKVEETPKWLQTLLPKAHQLKPIGYGGTPPSKPTLRPKSDEYEKFRTAVLGAERELLQTIAFSLTVQHPYKFLLSAVKALLPAESGASMSAQAPLGAERKRLAQMAWNFVNDSLRTTLCLQFEPKHIALAAIWMASKMTKIDLNRGHQNEPWYAKHGCDEKILNSVQTQIVDMYAKEGVANPLATPTHDATDSTGTPQRDTADKATAAPVETSASNANKASTSSNGAAGNTSGSLKRSAERAAGDESTARPLKQRSHSPPSQQGSNGNTSAAATASTATAATATDVAATTVTQPGHESEAKETRDETPTSAAADDDNTPRYTGAAAKAVHVAQSVAQAAARAVPDNSASPSNHGALTAAQGVALGGASQRNTADPSVMALLDDELNALKHDTPPHNKRTAALSVPARTRLERARSPGLNVRSNPY